MNKLELEYKQIIDRILKQPLRKTRNANTQSIFGVMMAFDELTTGQFPLLLGRKMFYKGVVGELAAFLKGPKTIEDFTSQGCNYWNDWGDEHGNINVDYGNAWIDYNGVNQLEDVVNGLKNDPFGRRHIITSWRPDRIKQLSLPCCHHTYQWYVTDDDILEMTWSQRSVDFMVGLPSDFILAALFNILMAQTIGLKPGRVSMMLGDTHIYESHKEGVNKYLDQVFVTNGDKYPTYEIDSKATVFNFSPDMFKISNYNPQDVVKFKLEV